MTPGKAFLSTGEIRSLAERSDAMGVWLVFHAWAVIALAVVFFALFPNPVTLLLAIAIVGSRQLGLAILMHEAAHNALFRTRVLNEFAGDWLCARPILADLPAYRHYHLTHHRFTQTDKDPDLSLSAKFPTTKASLKRKFWRDITGRTGTKQVLGQIAMSLRLAGDAEARDAARAEFAQAFKSTHFLTSLPFFLLPAVTMSLLGDWWFGLVFWVLPFLTWFQLVLRIRNIAEHGAVEVSENPLQNVRTTYANWIERAFIAPYWVNFHLEHHLVMHVPCWNLPRMHALMHSKGMKPSMRVAAGYGQALREAGWRAG
jgi:fatty acid desaturase